MALHWGPARETGTNGVRVGVDLSYSISGATATIVFELWVWTKRASFSSSASYSRSGAWSGGGSFSYSHTNNSSDWHSSNRTRIGRWTTTRTLQYGSTQSITAGGSVSGLGGNMPSGSTSHSRSITLPARPYIAPNAPQNVSVSRSSDARQNVSWTRRPTEAGPYTNQQVQRRYLQANGSWSAWSTRATVSGTATSYADSTASNWRYQYRVRATSGGGRWSGFATSPTIDTTPAAPSNVRARATATGIRVTWTNNASFPAETRIERQEGNGAWIGVNTLADGVAQWNWSSPDLTVTHRFRVRAQGLGTPSLNSGYATSNRVELAAPPAAPTNLGPSGPWDATEDHTITWRHVSTDGSEQTAFQMRRRLKGEAWVVATEQTTDVEAYTLPGGRYSNGDDIELAVRTKGVHPDWSDWSATFPTSPRARPTAAVNTPVEGETITTSVVVVEWGYSQEQGSPQVRWVSTLRDHNGEILQRKEGTTQTSTTYQVDNDRTYQVVVDVQSADGLWFRGGDEPTTFSVEFLPPQAPTISDVVWDPELGAAVVQIEQPVWDEGHAEPAFHQLWRAIDDGPWLLIADEIPLDTGAVTDPIPAIGDGRMNYYRATTVSVLPSTADSAVATLTVPSTGKGGTGGWVYLNAGPGMSQVCRVRANATRSDSEGVAKVLHHFAGRPAPVEYAGTARAREWDVSARIAPDYDGASTREELVELQALPAPVCYRDPLGARWFASMGPVASSWRSIMGEASWSMAEVDVTEGLDVQQRDTEGPE